MQNYGGTMEFQEEKRLVRAFHEAIDGAGADDLGAVLASYMAPDALWRGFHPFGELTGPRAVADTFWQPLRMSLTRMQRRQDIFFAGRNEMDGNGIEMEWNGTPRNGMVWNEME